MNIFPVTASLLMAGLALAPLADAAPKGKKPTPAKSSNNKKKNDKPKPAKKPEPKPTPAPTPAPAPAPTPLPEGQEDAYAAFIKALDQQVKDNSYDCCPAVSIALKALNGDEFAVQSWMKRASDAGNAAAQHYIASVILSSPQSLIGSKEVTDSLALLKSAADKDFIPAQLDYAIFLKTGRGVTQDTKAAEALMTRACRNKDMQARFKWLLLTDRVASAEDINRPEVKYEIERGNHYVLFYMLYYFKGEEQMNMLKKAAELGNPDAIYTLATVTLKTDPKLSYELLLEAVEKHNECAIFVLGSMLLEPDVSQLASVGLQKDYAKALHLLKTSFLLSNKEAGLALAGIYYDGLYDVPKDRAKAYRHYLYAYKMHGDMAAAAAAGIMMLKGDGVAQDTKTGWALLEAAHKAEADNAPILMAYAYYEGLGCEKDANKAIGQLQYASYTPYSYLFMAYIYAKGGAKLDPDPATADSYLRMAELDLGDQAKKLFDELMQSGKWEPHP